MKVAPRAKIIISLSTLFPAVVETTPFILFTDTEFKVL